MITLADLRRIVTLYLLSGLAGALVVLFSALAWNRPNQLAAFVAFAVWLWLLYRALNIALAALNKARQLYRAPDIGLAVLNKARQLFSSGLLTTILGARRKRDKEQPPKRRVPWLLRGRASKQTHRDVA